MRLCVVVVLCGFLFSESMGFIRNDVSLANAPILISSFRQPHLLNVNSVTMKLKSAQHRALSHPTVGRHCFSLDKNNTLTERTPLQPKHHFHDHVSVLDKTLVVGFIGFFGALLYKFVMSSAPGSWRYFLAGGLCAASSHAIPTPIDVIKVRHKRSCHKLSLRRTV